MWEISSLARVTVTVAVTRCTAFIPQVRDEFTLHLYHKILVYLKSNVGSTKKESTIAPTPYLSLSNDIVNAVIQL